MLTTALLMFASLWVGVSPAVATSTPVWAQLNPATSPPARFAAAIADDPAIGQLMLFGGSTGGSSFGDIGTVTIAQRGPKAVTTTAAASAGFTGHFRTNGGRGRVRYVTTSKACGVIVSPAGAIRTRGRLEAGHARCRWSLTLTIQP